MKYVYVLKTVKEDMTSYNGFKWPRKGKVKAKDWKPTKECGNGLHGALWGEGDGSLFNWGKDAKWLVLKVKEKDIVGLDGKVKFPECEVAFVGNQKEATDKLYKLGGRGPVIGCFRTGGDESTVSGGDESTVSGGIGSTVSGGHRSKVSGGNWSTVSGGDESTVSGGDESTVSGGNWSTVSGGHRSKVSGGNWSTVSGGYRSIVNVEYYDGERCRIKVFYPGEDGIKVNVKYKVKNTKGELEKVL